MVAQKQKKSSNYGKHPSMLRTKSNIPYILGGIGLIIIVILLVTVVSRPSDVVDRQQLQALEVKIQVLEKRLATVDLIDQALNRIGNNEKELNLIMARVDRFEGTVTIQIDQIIKELGKLQRKKGSAPAPKASAPQPATKSTIGKKRQVHVVSAGETLYSISRRYGLTVNQLQSYNNIGKDTTIRTGQKLKLSTP